jgi:hypothetical protein
MISQVSQQQEVPQVPQVSQRQEVHRGFALVVFGRSKPSW